MQSISLLSIVHSCFMNPFPEPSSHSSDDEPLTKAATHPQVTKILDIILERCDGEETGDAGSLKKPRKGTEYLTASLLMM